MTVTQAQELPSLYNADRLLSDGFKWNTSIHER